MTGEITSALPDGWQEVTALLTLVVFTACLGSIFYAMWKIGLIGKDGGTRAILDAIRELHYLVKRLGVNVRENSEMIELALTKSQALGLGNPGEELRRIKRRAEETREVIEKEETAAQRGKRAER